MKDLGDNNAMILRNHGLLTVGRSVAEAFQVMFNLQRACEIQLLAQAGGTPLTMIEDAVLAGVTQNIKTVRAGRSSQQLVWPALLRKVERASPGYDA